MKKLLVSLSLVLAVAIFAAGCKLTTPLIATSNPVGNKIGEAKGMWILTPQLIIPLVTDIGVYRAAKNGNISKISTVDWEFDNYIVFGYLITRVSGD
ncbi:MAG: TRL-like family protein [Spirochaetes bacterium]|jgi:hypothetical protein|nr:TRL-like family protein [Spirochaetota bacterium]